jgi:hypothetical protein
LSSCGVVHPAKRNILQTRSSGGTIGDTICHGVQQVTISEQPALFATVPPAALSDWLHVTLGKQTDRALRSGSEKARSELLITPILVEVYEQSRDHANLFSGVEFDVDRKQGLFVFCDFFFTLAPRTIEILAPVVSVVEAKKENILKGIPQCLAELVAAQIFNAAEERTIENLYGIVTTGDAWKFLRLNGTEAVIDSDLYYLDNVEKIVGIILSMLK